MVDDFEPGSIESTVSRLSEKVHELKQLLSESKREHYHCDDSWYCCPQCTSGDHPSGVATVAQEHYQTTECRCGADEWNKKVEKALE